MKATFFVVLNRFGLVKATKNRSSVGWDEVSMQLNFELPDVLFEKPQLQAFIEVKDEKLSPLLIDAETTDNIRQAIEQVAGMEVRLEIVNPNEGE